MSEGTNTLELINSRLDIVEEKTTELEATTKETIQNKTEKINPQKIRNKASMSSGTTLCGLILVNLSAQGRGEDI